MQKRVLNYRIIVEPEKYNDGSKVYVAHCPTLGISDYGDSIENALNNMSAGIKFHLDCLVEEGGVVPEPDQATGTLITYSSVPEPAGSRLAFA